MSTTTSEARTPVLPDEAEVASIILRPGSLTRRLAGDARNMFGSGYALMLQVAHPTVGAGVHEHSRFQEEPWNRLFRTLDYLVMTVYGEDDGAIMGRHIRGMHKTIKGFKPDGTRYHALEPDAYAWVHATLAHSMMRAHDRFISPLGDAQKQSFWNEFRPLGRLVGVRDRDLPDRWPEFQEYIAETISARLERTQSVVDVLETMDRPAAPPLRAMPRSVWKVMRRPPARVLREATIGLMEPELRRTLGIPWTRSNEAEFRAIARSSRAASPLLPRTVRQFAPYYYAKRRPVIMGQLERAGHHSDPESSSGVAAAA